MKKLFKQANYILLNNCIKLSTDECSRKRSVDGSGGGINDGRSKKVFNSDFFPRSIECDRSL